jgi:hypothetical protein
MEKYLVPASFGAWMYLANLVSYLAFPPRLLLTELHHTALAAHIEHLQNEKRQRKEKKKKKGRIPFFFTVVEASKTHKKVKSKMVSVTGRKLSDMPWRKKR